MAVVRKKQDDKFLKVLRELVTTGGGNRQCFDCGQKGPTYVNMTIGSFVCTRCSGVLRGLTPPHRVKSISMATFTQEEIDFLRAHGNDLCAKTWLGLWDPKRAVHQDHRELMIDKYESKRYYLEPASPLKSLTNAASLKSSNSIGSGNGSSSNGRGTSNSNVKNSSSTTTSNVLQQQQQLTNGYGNHLNNGSGNSNSSSSGNNNNNNNNSSAINISSSNNQQAGGSFDSSFQNITLTPPTSQRTTQSGLHKSSSTAISRPQNGYHPSQAQHDAFMTKNGGGGAGGGSALLNGFAASTAALSDTSSSASNGFGAEADFVADFGSANIFDATSSSSVGSPAVSSASSVATSNGYAKIQPMKATQFMNGVGGVGNHSAAAALMMNGGNIRNQQNGMNGHSISNNTKNISENFADFDHAPIFNAAENYKFVRKRNLKKSSTSSILQDKPQQQQQQQQQMMNSVTTTTTTTEDRNNFLNFQNHINNNNNSNTSSNNTKNCNNFYDFNSWHDIISLEEGKEGKEERSATTFNDCFNDDDFNFKHYNNSRITTAIHSNFGAEQKKHPEHQQEKIQQQPQEQKRFTPLAMAAHATAMAVLGSNSHFNVSNSNSSVSNDFDMQNPFAAPQWNSWQDMDSVESPITPTEGDSFWENNTSRSSSDSSTSDMLANGLIPTLTPFQSTPASSNAHFFTPNTAPVHGVQSVQGNSNAIPFPSTFNATSAGIKSTTAATASFSPTNPFRSHSDFNSILPDFDSSTSSPAGFFAHRSSSSSTTLDANSNVDSVPGWRLPMTNGYSNKQHAAASVKSATSVNNNNMSSSQNHISNNNKSSTPAEDRYAALKDLDEQLRESKAVAAAAATVVATNVADAFGNNNNNAGTNVNPFKLQQQHAAMVNPFQAIHQPQNLFGQMSTLTNGNLLTNGFQQPISAQQQQQQQHHHQQQQHQHTAFFNYSNGYTAAGAATSTMFPPPPPAPSSGPNGCGFGFGSMQQQIAAAAGGGGGAFNNPFAATGGALNSNNPFL